MDSKNHLVTGANRRGTIDAAVKAGDARRALEVEAHHPVLRSAATALGKGDLPTAERLVRHYLATAPQGVAGLCLLADIAERLGIYSEAASLLDRVLELVPAFHEAVIRRANLAFQMNRRDDALTLLSTIPKDSDDRRKAVLLQGRIYGLSGDYSAAEHVYRDLQRRHPRDPVIWCALGDVLKTQGRSDESLSAFREALRCDPGHAVAWWSISNLKLVRFKDDDIAAMERLTSTLKKSGDGVYLHFALGKAYEDTGEAANAFAHYQIANRMRREIEPHDRQHISEQVDRSIAFFSRDFFRKVDGLGNACPDPIFIVGMPRAGSTLIEQMLASHPLVEGTSELPDIPLLIHRLFVQHLGKKNLDYPDLLGSLPLDEWAVLGQAYLDAASLHRKSSRPYFIDKLPNNWLYAGFIHAILPNARIIDVRRAPMACCFSNYKQHFAKGQTFAYDLEDLAVYYGDYVRMMRHFDAVIPGAIYRIFYEELVRNPEAELRRAMEALDLDFRPEMLDFHRNKRAVRTASAEQVRMPISRDAIDHWREFEPMLGSLKAALGEFLNDHR